jgi:hypothetical protein
MDAYNSSRLDATYIDEIEPFTEELAGIVVEMQDKLVVETRILEGTDVFSREDIIIPPPMNPEETLAILTGKSKNELSGAETKQDQWSSDLLNGYSITDLVPISTLESNSSACIADLFNRECPIQPSVVRLLPALTHFYGATLEGCGCGTDAMNESCACMEQTISVPTVGMQSEEK